MVLDLTRLGILLHLLDGVLLGSGSLSSLSFRILASSSGETEVANTSSLSRGFTHGTDTHTGALDLLTSLVLTSWARELSDGLTSGLGSLLLGLPLFLEGSGLISS